MSAEKCVIDPDFKCFHKQQTLQVCTTIKTVLMVYGYQSKNVWLAITHSKIGWLQIIHNGLAKMLLHCFRLHCWIKSRINILTVRLKSAQACIKIHCPVFTPCNNQRNWKQKQEVLWSSDVWAIPCYSEMQQSITCTYQSHSASMNCYNDVPYGGTYHVNFATALHWWMGTKKVPVHLPHALHWHE